MMSHQKIAALSAGLFLALSMPVNAQISDDVVRIGFLSDLAGPFSAAGGLGSLDAIRMAIADFGGKVNGKPIDLIFADHLNKPDTGLAIAREWYDDKKVDVILDISNSAIALGVQKIAWERKRIFINTASGTSELTGKACSPYGITWTYDTYSLAAGVASALTKRGLDTWFFLTVDYAFGTALQRDATDVINANKGRVLGAVRHPLNTSDMSSFLLQAQASSAKVIGLANGTNDAVNAIKQAREFGLIQSGKKVAALLFVISDVHGLGLQSAQGVQLVEAFYWDQNDESRAFARRFFERNKKMPTMMQVGNYTATLFYLKAIEAAGTDDAGAVMKKMKASRINDFMTRDAYIREDGRVMRDMYLYEVKSPSESKGPWDYYKLVQRIPAEEVTRSLKDGGCPLVNK